MTDIVLVAAVAENGVIGRDNALPWRLKSDLRHFRALTIGKPVLMGRKTFFSIGKPLLGRTNIVVSRNLEFAGPGIIVARDLANAVTVGHGDALRRGVNEIMVIGGGHLFAALLPQACRLEITRVHARPDGDAVFPRIDPTVWREMSRIDHAPGPDDDAAFSVLTYRR
jgi:dihydrofolate reductase